MVRFLACSKARRYCVYGVIAAALCISEAWAMTPAQRYQELMEGQASNPLHAPVTVESKEQGDAISADAWGVLDAPFERAASIVNSPAAFCDFISVVIFVKACTFAATAAPATVTLYMGRKDYEDPNPDNALAFQYSIEAQGGEAVMARLFVARGSLGVKDNRLEFELWRVAGQTLAHVHASYIASVQSNLAMGTYLMTMGRNKIGFSTVPDSTGKPKPVKGALGIIERNAMRYFLALQSTLATQNVAADQREAARLEHWFDATAKYELLFEVPRAEYLDNKKRERANQVELQRKVDVK